MNIKEEEYLEVRSKMEKLELENKRLKEQLKQEVDQKIILESKLKRNAILQELKDNSSHIQANTFFEMKRSKLSQLNSTLLSNVHSILNTHRSINNTNLA